MHVFVSENGKQRRQIHVSQKRHVLRCICVYDEQCWWVHWLCSINILCHASAERWELLALGLMSITPPCSVKECWKEHSCLNSREDVLIIIPNCKETSHDLHPCYFQAKDRRLQAPLWEWFHPPNVIDLKRVWLAGPLRGFSTESIWFDALSPSSKAFLKWAPSL